MPVLQIQAGKVEDGDRLRRSCGKADVGTETEETTQYKMREGGKELDYKRERGSRLAYCCVF